MPLAEIWLGERARRDDAQRCARGIGRDRRWPQARAREEETIVFDSSGTALQVAAAVAVHRQALAHGEGAPFSFNA
jgi:hypothetical protein